MEAIRNFDSMNLNSGIYLNSKKCRTLIDRSTRAQTLKRKMKRRLRDGHYLVNKVKIAAAIFIVVALLSKLFIG